MSETVHNDIYNRLNNNTERLAELIGKTDVLVDQNDKLLKLIKTVIWMMFFVILSLVFTLIYGAVGDKGLHAVRETLPHMPIPATADCPPAPWVDDMRSFFATLARR